MKLLNTRIILFISCAIVLVSFYQLYWLINYYYDLRTNINQDIQEVLRSSDFEELAHRVEEISKQKTKGRIDVNIGYDHSENKQVTKSSINKDAEIRDEERLGTHTVASPESFGNILKSHEDLVSVGLNMQRGIHSSIDMIKEIDFCYLDSVITEKLNSLGLNCNHQLLYIKTDAQTENNIDKNSDTLINLVKGENHTSSLNKSFILKVSEDSEYHMIIPGYNLAIIRKMIPVILFSVFTLILIIVTFIYLIRFMHRQRELDEIKSDFTNNITHELKTPIAVAFAANDALLNFDSANNTPRMNRYLKVSQEQLSLLDRLVEQILSLSMDRNKPLLLNNEEINMKGLVASLVKSFYFKYSGKVRFTLDVDEELRIESDRMHVSNILSNLIDNAIKYSYERAEVTIKGYYNKENDCVLEVIDKGIGITKEQQKFIFDKFYRVPRGNVHDVKGYGLGLFYVKSMTERLGGSVSVKSTYGKGSTFILIWRKK